MIVFSRAFLSFSKEKEESLKFRKKITKTYSIFYVIQEIENVETNKIKIYNADLDDISANPNEKEVLIFPYSCFEINEKKNYI